MKKNFERVVDLLSFSNQLSKSERIEFCAWLSFADDRELAPLVPLFKKDSFLARRLYENFKLKSHAFKTHQPELFKQILEEEKKLFE